MICKNTSLLKASLLKRISIISAIVVLLYFIGCYYIINLCHQSDDNANAMTTSSQRTLLSFDFEVFGRVQGVFFRKYTKTEAKRLGLVGWIRNTPRNTVEGQVQGSERSCTSMKHWLRNTGSPHSRIERANFTNEKQVSALEFKTFEVRH